MLIINGRRQGGGFFGGLGCLLTGLLFAVLTFWFLKGLYRLLWWAAPALFVLTLIINWRVIAATAQGWWRQMQRDPLSGLLTAALGVVMFPVLCLFWFLGALGSRRFEQFTQQFTDQWGTSYSDDRHQPHEDEFVEFEELDSTPGGRFSSVDQTPSAEKPSEPVTPPPAPEPAPEPKKKDTPPENPYDTLFK